MSVTVEIIQMSFFTMHVSFRWNRSLGAPPSVGAEAP
jgi:hypothetical protein